MADTDAPAEGLRSRKKRDTRTRIAAVAMDLFAARGFDAVTVAEVAHAAGVSEKTVFNYFPGKEDLVFARGEQRRNERLEAVRNRPPEQAAIGPFREMTMRLLDGVEHDPVETTVAVPRLVMGSRALRERLLVEWEREAELFTPAVAGTGGTDENDLVPLVMTRTLTWAHRLVFRTAFKRLLAGEDRRAVAADLREQATRIYDQLEEGLGDYGRGRA